MSNILNEREKEQELKNNNRQSPWAISAIVGGAALIGAATIGVLSNEAKSPQDAIMSVDFGEDHVYYIESEELPLVFFAGLGIVAVTAGILSRKNEEE